MKPKITLDNWRFEYIKDAGSSWNLLKVGGVIRSDDPEANPRNATPFTDTVVDLQGFREQPQFLEGFEFETESRVVVLGKKENFSA